MDAQVKSARQVAYELLTETSWDYDKALKKALDVSKAQPHLMTEALRVGWESLLNSAKTAQRDFCVRRVVQQTDASARIRKVVRMSVMETYLVGNTPLGRCTADDLRRDIALRTKNADTEQKRAEFARQILKKMKPSKKVSDCWNETDVQELMRRVLGDAA